MELRKRKRLSVDEYVSGILAGDRIILSKAITLVESKLNEDNDLAEEVIEKILPHTGNSTRIGITGVPGVGKSTFIESFGLHITSLNKKLAVLAIDPSSQLSKGSIMGDKTRMEELSRDPLAYIRPTASGATLGGVGNKTRESMLLCEAAGFDVIFIETVGVGQSEIAVHGMVDIFLLLLLAGAGDELQGIKKGIMEMADILTVTKADGDNEMRASKAQREVKNALHLFPARESGWTPEVLTCSAVNNIGIENIWESIQKHQELIKSKDHFESNRTEQDLNWMHETIKYNLENRFYNDPTIRELIKEKEEGIRTKRLASIKAAKDLLQVYKK